MPNHCTNSLSCISGKNIGEVIKPYLTDKGDNIDFNKILPMPEGIYKTTLESTIEKITEPKTKEEIEARQKEHDLLQEQNLKDYGYKNWYDWSVDKWDTKWNAYSCWTLEDDSINDVDDFGDIGFQTAWSPPIAVIRELAKLTGETLRMTYFDEGYMFAGEYIVGPDGEQDNCYEDMDEIPEGSDLYYDLDLDNYYQMMEDNEEEED